MKKGFTLIEMLVVIFIMGILSSIALPKYQRSVERARVAEAQTLLRSIFESRERVIWERGDTKYEGKFGFDKLDITVKGTYANSEISGAAKAGLQTDNFFYDMYNDGRDVVGAVATKGKYAGARIVYDGSQFECIDDEAPGACASSGENTWNQL